MELKEKLQKRLPVLGGWTSLAHPSITEIFTQIGLDFIGIDLEHSTISQEQAQRIIAASQAAQTLCLPRISSHNAEQIKRLLDSGADGIIVPNVCSKAEVKQLVQWSKYPPVGKRSYGVARAQAYGFQFEEYVSRWNERSVLILQIEAQAGVEALEGMLRHPEVDGVMVGPYDLSGDLGIPGQLAHPRVLQACQRVVETCRKMGKACGTQIVDPALESVKAAFQSGYTFVILSSDIFALWKWSQRMRSIRDAI